MQVLRESLPFNPFVQHGKRGLKGEHRELLIEHKLCSVAASIDFEAAADRLRAKAKRVDYLIATTAAPKVSQAIEIHAFHPKDLIGKKQGTLAILARHCPGAVNEIQGWHVIIVGTMPRADIRARFTASSHMKLAGRRLELNKL